MDDTGLVRVRTFGAEPETSNWGSHAQLTLMVGFGTIEAAGPLQL